MYLTLWFLLFAGTTLAFHLNPAKVVPFRDLGPRIVNGRPAEPGQFPWQVAIYVNNMLCGGSLISNKWILTAGHCVSGVNNFRIALGSTTLVGNDPNRLVLDTTESILHEKYDPSTLDNDIALIAIPEVTFTDFIQSIPLASDDLKSGTTVTVSGWGLTSDGDDGASNDLNYVDLITISNENCEEVYSGIVNNGVVCATGKGDAIQSTCEGDSGGPLVANWDSNPVHVGVVSFGHPDGCESGNPAGFRRTASYRDWIKEKTGV